MGENNCTEEKVQLVKLRTEVKNCIRHVYETLEESNSANDSGKVTKSKLQLLCATIGRDISMAYSSEDLALYKENEKSLTCPEFIKYLEEELLPKASVPIDLFKIKQLCWTIVHQTFLKQETHILSENEAFDQWLAFNILDLDEISRVHKEELALLLEKLTHAMGVVWDGKRLEKFCEEEDMSFWQYLECLENCYITGVDKNLYKEGLQEIADYVLHEVIKQGYLIKKGHMVKSMKDRWFVLKPGNLSYFTNRTCNDKKGEIIITQETKVVSVPDSRKYRFSVVCGETKTHYDLEARDQRTKQEWISAIHKAIETSEGPSVQTKERLQRRLERNERRLVKMEEDRKKRDQEELLRAQQKELELLRQKYSDAEAQALLEAENLQEEKRRREELERLHQELQTLLLAEKEAREAEAHARALQEELLNEEKRRMEELERVKAEKDELLEEELRKRETLEEKQKIQDRMLEEERQRLDKLERERQATEQAMKEAQHKLLAAEEAASKASEEAKKKVWEIKSCTGLAKPISPQAPQFVTHRGIGSFCELDFEKIQKNHEKTPPKVLPKPKRQPKEGGDLQNGADVMDAGENEAEANERQPKEEGDLQTGADVMDAGENEAEAVDNSSDVRQPKDEGELKKGADEIDAHENEAQGARDSTEQEACRVERVISVEETKTQETEKTKAEHPHEVSPGLSKNGNSEINPKPTKSQVHEEAKSKESGNDEKKEPLSEEYQNRESDASNTFEGGTQEKGGDNMGRAI